MIETVVGSFVSEHFNDALRKFRTLETVSQCDQHIIHDITTGLLESLDARLPSLAGLKLVRHPDELALHRDAFTLEAAVYTRSADKLIRRCGGPQNQRQFPAKLKAVNLPFEARDFSILDEGKLLMVPMAGESPDGIVFVRNRHGLPIKPALPGVLSSYVLGAMLVERNAHETVMKQALSQLLDKAANVNHDYRNGVGVLDMAVAALAKFTSEPDIEMVLKSILGIKEKMKALSVEFSSAIAEIRTHGLEGHSQPFHPQKYAANDLAALVEKYLSMWSYTRTEKKIRMHYDLQERVLPGEPEAIDRLVSNIIINAMKYTPVSGHVWVSSRFEMSGAGESLVFDVQNTDIGNKTLRQEEILKLTGANPQRLGRHVKLADGTGLGMMTVRSIMEAHGGHFEVLSKLREKKPTFIINCYFPMRLKKS